MAIADIFLKLHGVTGESSDTKHKSAIEVVSWSWGMQGATALTNLSQGSPATVSELHIVKRVDMSSVTLMRFLWYNKVIEPADFGDRVVASGLLTVRKAGDGGTSLEYYRIELDNVRVTSFKTEATQGGVGLPTEVVEHVTLGFTKARINYTPQSATGSVGGGTNMIEIDAQGRR